MLQSKHAGLTSFRWPVMLSNHNFFLPDALCNASGFSHRQRTHLTKLSYYHIVLVFHLPSQWWKENKLILSCRKLECLKILNGKKWPVLLFYLFWQTRDNLNSYTRLDYSILPLLRDLTFLWLCPSLWFSSLLWLSLLWLSFHEALQSCFTNLPALDSIPYYSILCSTFLRGRQSALTSL